MKRSGEITVFLSMCLLCISALLCVMLESARTAGSRYYFQVAAGGAVDTLFSRYHRRLWEEYRVFAMEYGSQEEIAKDLENYINEYLAVENWYPMKLESVDITQLINITDQEGDYLVKEVLDYMKLGAVRQVFMEPSQGEQLVKDIKEAASIHSLSDAYDRQEKEVRKLEQTVENLIANIQEQEQMRERITKALKESNAKAFFRAAEKYQKTAEKYPNLLKHYEKQAEALTDRYENSQDKIDEVQEDFQDNREALFREQWNPYETYIVQNGPRRQEFVGWQDTLESNLSLLTETERLVEAAEYDYEEGENEEESISLKDAENLWRTGSIKSNFTTQAGNGDKEKQNLLDQVKGLVEGGLLEVVMPKDTVISSISLPAEGFPSKRVNGGGLKKSDYGSGAEQIIIGEYCSHFFTNALSSEKHPVQYELEYLLQGESVDRKNLEKTVMELFAVREGLNLIHILSDSRKRQEAETLALVITGTTGLAPLAKIVACVIMGVWAMGESIQDLRILMSGGNVPLWKQKDEWNISLEGLLDMGRGVIPDKGISKETSADTKKGLTYSGYLKLLLLKEDSQTKHMRMLDLMQMNIGWHEPEFSILGCAYGVSIRGKAKGNHIFFALPIVESFVKGENGYILDAVAEKAY